MAAAVGVAKVRLPGLGAVMRRLAIVCGRRVQNGCGLVQRRMGALLLCRCFGLRPLSLGEAPLGRWLAASERSSRPLADLRVGERERRREGFRRGCWGGCGSALCAGGDGTGMNSRLTLSAEKCCRGDK